MTLLNDGARNITLYKSQAHHHRFNIYDSSTEIKIIIRKSLLLT